MKDSPKYHSVHTVLISSITIIIANQDFYRSGDSQKTKVREFNHRKIGKKQGKLREFED